MAQILSPEHLYLRHTSWGDQNIYMKRPAYPRFSILVKYNFISSETPHSNAFLHFTPLFGRWGASPLEPSSRLL